MDNIIDIPAQLIDAPEGPAETTTPQADRWRESIRSAAYPQAARDTLLAFVDLIETEGLSQSKAAALVKHGARKNALSGAALSQLLTGRYPADPTAICRAIDRAIALHRGRSLFAVSGFVQTRLYDALVELADIAVLTQRIACLHGGLLAGKTTNAHALAAQYDRAAVVLMTCPYADTYGGFVRRLATLRNVPHKGTLSDIREGILATFDSSHLLVIDEFHQPLVTYARSQCLRVLEFIREINDARRCGILLVGSSAGHSVLATDPLYERLAGTLTAVDICAPRRDLTPSGSDADLRAIAASFGLPADPEGLALCRAVCAGQNAAKLFDALRLASARAETRRQPLTWSTVAQVTTAQHKLAA